MFSTSDNPNGSYSPLRHTASSPVGMHVLVHDALDDSTGFYHMVRSSGRRGFAVSWSSYLVFAVLWFWFGIQKNDKNIYLSCVDWIVLDSAVIIGVIIHG